MEGRIISNLDNLLSAFRKARSPAARQKLAEQIRIFKYKSHQSLTPSGRLIRR